MKYYFSMRTIYFGSMAIKPGDFLHVLVSGRVYIVKVTEVTEYSQIVGEDPDGNPVMIKVSKITAIRKITEEEFRRRSKNVPTA